MPCSYSNLKKEVIRLNDTINTARESEKKDARDTAEFIKKQRDRDSLLSNFIGVALSSYINGIHDAQRSFNAAVQTVS